jgi:enoyl-CoA hydratase/carnithine racemase
MLHETREGSTAILTLDNPARRNALSAPMRRSLGEALERLQTDPTVRAIVLTGAGGVFCSGGDLAGMDANSLAAGRERFRASYAMLRLLAKGAKPAIAAVEGWCAGAGVGLALCCDTVVAGEGARFMLPFAKVGLIPDFGLFHTLPLRIGAGRARQMMLYGEAVDATRAEQIGLADHLVPSGSALAFAIERANMLAAIAPQPLAYIRHRLAEGLDAALDWERETQSALYLTADHVEGRTAFLEKRAPIFKGS